MVKEKRVLPADVYDTLEFSALAFGGIGAFSLYEDFAVPDKEKIPFCILGHADTACNLTSRFTDRVHCPVHVALGLSFGGDWGTANANNDAVTAINERKRRPEDTRVSWEEYTRELNIVRGD